MVHHGDNPHPGCDIPVSPVRITDGGSDLGDVQQLVDKQEKPVPHPLNRPGLLPRILRQSAVVTHSTAQPEDHGKRSPELVRDVGEECLTEFCHLLEHPLASDPQPLRVEQHRYHQQQDDNHYSKEEVRRAPLRALLPEHQISLFRLPRPEPPFEVQADVLDPVDLLHVH